MDVEIQYDDRELQRTINRLIAAGGDRRAAMREVAGHLADSVADSFDRQTTREGAPWKPLEPKTVRDPTRARWSRRRWRTRSGTRSRRPYARSDLFERRRRLMNDWEAYLNGDDRPDLTATTQ